MAPLLTEEQKNKQASETEPVTPTTVQSTPPAGVNTTIPLNQVQQKQPQKKGTGFTNLNRIMQANQGNRLGQTVAGGVTQAGQNLQSGVRQSQATFQTDADKARVDTEANAAKRANVLGRFDASTYKPDESKFKVSGGLQSQYEQNKTAQQVEADKQKAQQAAQLKVVQDKLASDRANIAAINAAEQKRVADILEQRKTDPNAGYWSFDMGGGGGGRIDSAVINNNMENYGAGKGYKASIESLSGVEAALQAASAYSQKQAADNLAKLETQYGEMTNAEKSQYMKSETERLMAENAPTESEIKDFTTLQSGAYTGPKELGDFQTLLGKAQQTEQLGGLARSTGGRQELLKQFVGGRDYTQGQRGLDEAILGQDKTSLLSKAAKSVRGSEQSVSSANKLAGAQAQDLVGKAKQFGQETQKQIADKRGVISSQVDEQVRALQGSETGRQKDFESLQGMLSGTDPRVAGMDPTTRMGVALQSAMDSGYLSPQEADDLVGQGGLVQRAQAAGLDPNALLGERLKSIAAQGIDRRAAATGGQEGIISAMDRLSGKVGPDVEFGAGQDQFQAGKNSFDVASLKDYIAKTEAEKMKDPAYVAKLQQLGLSPMQQVTGGIGQALNAGPGGMTGTLATGGVLTGLQAVGDLATGGDTAAQVAEGAVQTASGVVGMGLQGKNAILKALSKYSPAGVAINALGGGSQLQKMLDYQDQITQKGLGELTKEGMNMAGGLRSPLGINQVSVGWV